MSESFLPLNGLKQSGILSPFSFSVYINDLLTSLEKFKVGCFFGHTYFGYLVSAEDVIILASFLATLRVMLAF